jgi:hypothetical protein
MIAMLQRMFLLLLLALDWAVDPALLSPAVQLLAKPWCSTENVCPSGAYQQAVLRQSRRHQVTARQGPGADAAPPEFARPLDVVRMPSALNPVCHLYIFMSLRR